MEKQAHTIVVAGKNAANHPVGTVCYEFRGHDYGCAYEDTAREGESYNAMTLDPQGGIPFFTCAVASLDPRPEPQYEIND